MRNLYKLNISARQKGEKKLFKLNMEIQKLKL